MPAGGGIGRGEEEEEEEAVPVEEYERLKDVLHREKTITKKQRAEMDKLKRRLSRAMKINPEKWLEEVITPSGSVDLTGIPVRRLCFCLLLPVPVCYVPTSVPLSQPRQRCVPLPMLANVSVLALLPFPISPSCGRLTSLPTQRKPRRHLRRRRLPAVAWVVTGARHLLVRLGRCRSSPMRRFVRRLSVAPRPRGQRGRVSVGRR